MKHTMMLFGAVVALLLAGQVRAAPADSIVKQDVAGVHLGSSLSEALIALKRQGYQLQDPPTVSCEDTQYNGVTIKPCGLNRVELKKVDDEGSNDIVIEVTPGVSERIDWALEEAVVWRVSLYVTLSDPNQAVRSTFDAMVKGRYPSLVPVDANSISNFTNCEISSFNVSLPAYGYIAITPADERLPLGSRATVHCSGIFAGISLRPGFGSIPDTQGLDVTFFDNEMRDRVEAFVDDKLVVWAKQDASHPIAPRF
jgi:hypothetical protein